ncbi:MAG: O-antigen ligase family protein [Bacteroidota bacterium]
MKEFLTHNAPVFSSCFILLMLGNIDPVLGSVVLAGIMLIWAIRERNNWLILMFACTLILGDSRLYFFLPFKGMRYVAISILFLKTVYDIARGRYGVNRLLFLSIPFFIVAFFGVAVSPVKGVAIAKAISYLFLLIICLSFAPYYFRKGRHRLLFNLLHLAILVYILGILFLVLNPSWAYLNDRYRGFFGNPNGLGTFSTMMIPFAVMMLNRFPEKKRAAFVLIGLGFFSIILSESRTALGTTSLFFALYLIYKGGKLRRNFFWFFGLPIIVFIFMVVPLETLVGLVGLEEFLRVESLKTGTGRFLAWGLGLTEIQNNLWIGRGFGYEEHFFYQLREFLVATEHQGGMHNSYLTFLMNNGILGSIPFAIFLIVLFRKVKIKKFAFPFIIVVLISANFESWLNSSLNAFTFFFFVILSFLISYKTLKPKI